MLKVIHWPFKNFGNFAIASVGLCGLSFWGYSIYSEGKFNQPIIGESIKLLGKHPQIKELAGLLFPIQDIRSLTASPSAISLYTKREGNRISPSRCGDPRARPMFRWWPRRPQRIPFTATARRAKK